MKKYIIIFLVLLLSACTSGLETGPAVGTFKNVEVLSKRTEKICARGCWHDYYVKFGKGKQIVELESLTENTYNALVEGSIVTVSYDKDFLITKIEFSEIGEEVVK